MTTCAAYLDNAGRAAIAIDECATGHLQYTGSDKLHRVGDLWVAYSGDLVVSRFLRRAEPVPATYEGAEALADALHAWWRARGSGQTDGEGAWRVDASLIAVAPGQAPWFIGCTGHVGQPHERYVAAGSGAGFATGVMYAHRRRDTPAEDVVREAIEAAPPTTRIRAGAG